jgi:hypothetical protein
MSRRGGSPYSLAERQAIIAGEFFTAGELAARPWLGRTVLADAARKAGPAQRRDPNTVPMTRAERAAVDALVPVCGLCHEPGDDRSALNDRGYHPECEDDWQAERAGR